MNIIFFGNTKYSTIGAKIVQATYPISLFVTINDSPVVLLASELKVPKLITNKLDEASLEKIKEYKPDFLVVEDYGLILPKRLLDMPKIAPLNIHHSLLPKYRGPSPAPSAILNGDKVSGVTIIKMNEEVDAGEILAQEKYTLSLDETTNSLLTKLNELGAKLLIKVINQHLEGSAKAIPQDDSQTTYTKRFRRKDGYFDINNPPDSETLDRMVRAYFPWPGVWTKWNGKIVKFLPTLRHSGLSRIDSGVANAPQNDRYLLQMEGKKPISFKDFLNGYPDFPLRFNP